MTQHGFARDMNFNLVDTADNSISYKLTSNEDTKKYYPYSFELIITYKLINNNKNHNNKYKYLEPFVIRSKDKSIELSFTPILDRYDNINFGVIKSVQHQVFGRVNGTIKVEGKEVEFKDFISFVERVTNWL